MSNPKTAVVEQALFVNCHSTKCDCEEADVQTMENFFQGWPMRSLNKPGELARLEGIPRTRRSRGYVGLIGLIGAAKFFAYRPRLVNLSNLARHLLSN